MKKLFFLLATFVSVISWGQTIELKSLGKRKALLWKEEFNYTGLPDSTKWGYEEGFVRNNEKQFYARMRKENSYVENGNLVIVSKKEEYRDAQYTSASINTLGKQSFEGNMRIEIKAKLPKGKGIWPAIWMMGTNISSVNWPKCSETDIMEYVGHTPGVVWGTFHWWDSTASDSDHHLSKGSKLNYEDLHTNYHIYGMERKDNVIQLFVDDHYYNRFTVPQTAYPQSFTGPLYLLLNTAIGGDWGGPVDDSIFPQKFYIDYVRVYRLK